MPASPLPSNGNSALEDGGLLPLQLILLLIKHQKLWAEHLAQNGFTRETGIVKWRYETMGQEGLV
ncbi:WSSV361 [White spot syndrome virus]|uniref:WSSV361 n=1 Tax=White spot syndrome virus TaxID=342409 RepID=A0A2I6SC58_9VIRU|nr:WSSV361 [White spot syndrome virus]